MTLANRVRELESCIQTQLQRNSAPSILSLWASIRPILAMLRGRRITTVSGLTSDGFVIISPEALSLRPTVEVKTAILEQKFFTGVEEPEKECGICRADFTPGELVMKTTCCGTKLLHPRCTVQCLRNSELCPFCRAAKISFQ